MASTVPISQRRRERLDDQHNLGCFGYPEDAADYLANFVQEVHIKLRAVEADISDPRVSDRLEQIVNRARRLLRAKNGWLPLNHSLARCVAYEAATGIHPDLARLPEGVQLSELEGWFLDNIGSSPSDRLVTSEMLNAHLRQGVAA